MVARVTEPATVFPGSMALGATRSTRYAQASAEIMARELKSLGINFDMAPGLDVNVNPANPVINVRSFSEDPDLVTQMGLAQIRGFQGQNIVATAKHFPGHGDTDVDSHYGLPIIHHDRETLEKVDLKPFRAAIDAGIDEIIMKPMSPKYLVERVLARLANKKPAMKPERMQSLRRRDWSSYGDNVVPMRRREPEPQL